MNRFETNLHGAGLGLRRSLMGPLAEAPAALPDFLEVAPENWIGVGGRLGRQFRAFTERHRFVLHGLSLSLGGPTPVDRELVNAVGALMRTHAIALYSEHLSYCTDQGHLYDLMPIPFTEAAVAHVAARIRQVQDMLGQRIAIENVSYYAAPGREMSELEFLLAVLEAADCDLLLDVNNVYVNAHNHAYDPLAFIQQLPGERIAYLHVAGHYQESEDLIIDTHGAEIIDPVWDLLEQTYARFGPLPTLLERDFNLPPLPDLLREVDHIRTLQRSQETVHDKCA
ncbi:MAG: DUF692 domain-containing protein [Candidatus Thiodiazotropha sp.]